MEGTYAWAKVEGAAAFTRVTLSDRNTGDRQWKQELHRKMWQALNDIQPQVVVVPGWAAPDALSALAWCVHNKTQAVVMSESTAWDERRVSWKEWLKNRLVKLTAAGLAGGTPHADYLVQLGMPHERIFLGYDVVDNGYFAAKAAEVRSWKMGDGSGKKAWGGGQRSEGGKLKSETGGLRPVGNPTPHPDPLPDRGGEGGEAENGKLPAANFPLPTGPFFLASARFIEKKNLPRLLQAYARYRALAGNAEMRKSESGCPSTLNPQPSTALWDLVLLGDGPLRSAICDLRSALGLEACVHLPGFKQYDELPEYYARAGVFLHASTTEQWGLVVNEAMASGLPVLVSNRCGCAQDLVKENVNGFTFDPYNTEQMAELMVRVSDSGFPLADFGAASARIISEWGPERFAAGLKDAVDCALKIGPVKPTLLQRLILKAMLVK